MQVKCRKDAGLGSTMAKDAGHFCRSCRGGGASVFGKDATVVGLFVSRLC